MTKRFLRKTEHDVHLERIVSHLELIGQTKRELKYCFPNVSFLFDGRNLKFCDIVLAYDVYGVPIELKKSFGGKDKALEQMANGASFLEREMKLVVPYGKIVFYGETALPYRENRLPYVVVTYNYGKKGFSERPS